MCNKCTTVCKPVPHVHAGMITEWVKDTSRTVQWLSTKDREWFDCGERPAWYPQTTYRFKPEKKPDIVQYIRSVVGETTVPYPINVWPGRKGVQKQTFDGETGDLKSLEIVQ